LEKRPGCIKEIRNFYKEKLTEKEDGLNELEKNIMEAADEAIKNRIKPKEDLKEFLEKKKEMFLMQMEINLKKEKIHELEEKLRQKKKGLLIAEDYIKKVAEDIMITKGYGAVQ
jgi:flagellar biosynthesis/type III secretory pathway chaperone